MLWQEKYKKLAALPCKGERPIIGITANFGEYGSQLAEAYYESVRLSGGVPIILPASTEVDDLEDFLASIDALMFSGGGDINPLLLGQEPEKNLRSINAKRDEQELILVRRALDKQMPILAICRGVQVLAAATGGKLIQDIYTSTQLKGPLLKHSQELERSVASHTIKIEEGTLLHQIIGSNSLAVNSFHHQAVLETGPGFRISALSPDGVVEAIESDEFKPVIGVQWHPESFWQQKENAMRPLFDWLVKEAEQYKKARHLHSRILTLDTHCDTPMFFHLDIDFAKRDDRILVDSSKMRDGGLDASIMAAYLKQGPRDERSLLEATRKAHTLLRAIESRIASAPMVSLAETPSEIYELKRQGRLAILKGIENGYAIGRDLRNIEAFRQRGVVYMTLCHNGDNDICDSASQTQSEHGGLSPFGREVIKEMNRVGMMVDLSHGGARSFYDALETSRLPIVCSHTSCRALCDHVRNLEDEQMRQLARAGGVMQITLYPGFLKKDSQATILDAMAHLDHAIKVMGVEHVGLGSDFDGDGGVRGLANASEMINFTRQLLKRRYSEDDIQKIWGGNFLRTMQQVQDAAK